MQVAQVLFPALLAIVNTPAEYGATVRRRALQIAHSMAVMLAGIQGNADRDSSKAIGTLLDAWFQPLCVMLSQPTTAHVQILLLPLPYSTTVLVNVPHCSESLLGSPVHKLHWHLAILFRFLFSTEFTHMATF